MRKLLGYARRAVDDFGMIESGDRIAVGVSGGKDSLCALVALAGLRCFYPKPFSLCAISIDMGFAGMDYSGIQALCDGLEIPYRVEKSQIAQVLFEIRKEENPCSLCAKMRRGNLGAAAKEMGCSKVALGHHSDDVIETFFLSLFYEGRIHCFAPVTELDRSGITQIRPLLYAPESFLRDFATTNQLPVVHNPCPANGHTSRQQMKELIEAQNRLHPGLKQRIFRAILHSDIAGFSGSQRL